MNELELANPKRERFARLLAQGEPVLEAYHSAGYSKKSRAAHRLANEVEVRRRVEQLRRDAADICDVTIQEVITGLREVQRLAIEGEPMYSMDGTEIGTRRNLGAALRALELLGKIIGAFNADLGQRSGNQAIVVAYPTNPLDERIQ